MYREFAAELYKEIFKHYEMEWHDGNGNVSKKARKLDLDGLYVMLEAKCKEFEEKVKQ